MKADSSNGDKNRKNHSLKKTFAHQKDICLRGERTDCLVSGCYFFQAKALIFCPTFLPSFRPVSLSWKV